MSMLPGTLPLHDAPRLVRFSGDCAYKAATVAAALLLVLSAAL